MRVGERDHRFESFGVGAVRHPPHGVDLGIVVGIAERGTQQEPVELRLGEAVGALLLDRVLGGDHDERPRHVVRIAVDGDVPLLHHFEHRGLRLRRGAVDLVGKDDVGEHRAGPELERAVRLVVDQARP